eukprot:TRINITY_DN1091_c0_g1_i1.p1 TRINITY_DN1091_c0_g1~~TRINITY_DN1091_c0_g1_i1.p1  ORF type:complete len:439 (+),score=123.38 TRINITY_DN1091_c0_g1_i1:83-1318(+)
MSPPADCLPRGSVQGVFTRASSSTTTCGLTACVDKVRFARDRLGAGAEVAVGLDGLCGSADWHSSERGQQKMGHLEHRRDRAVLVQSSANRAALLSRQWDGLKRPLDAGSLLPGSLGENIYVDGLPSAELCIGDRIVAERQGRPTGLVFAVASPRRTCATVDAAHGGSFGDHGVRALCARTGLAGWFARVHSEGTLAEGDTLVVRERPNPSWTVERVARVIYGKAARTAKYEMIGSWNGTDQELEELAALPELGWIEWRGRARDTIAERTAAAECPGLRVGARVRLRRPEAAGQRGYDCIGAGEEGVVAALEDAFDSPSRYIAALAEFGRPYRVTGPSGGVQWYSHKDLEVVPDAPQPLPQRQPSGLGRPLAAAAGSAAVLGGALFVRSARPSSGRPTPDSGEGRGAKARL